MLCTYDFAVLKYKNEFYNNINRPTSFMKSFMVTRLKKYALGKKGLPAYGRRCKKLEDYQVWATRLCKGFLHLRERTPVDNKATYIRWLGLNLMLGRQKPLIRTKYRLAKKDTFTSLFQPSCLSILLWVDVLVILQHFMTLIQLGRTYVPAK